MPNGTHGRTVLLTALLTVALVTACGATTGPATGGGVDLGVGGGAEAAGGGGAQGLGGGAGPEETRPTLHFTSAPSKVKNLPAGARFAGAVPYGPEDEQLMDVFLPAATAPTPLVFFIHGGGFQQGNRVNAYVANAQGNIATFLAAGVAFITIDYRLLKAPGQETTGVRKCLGDAALAVQYVRRWAEVFNIDPARVASYGNSAGAGTSLWLALHDDLADPQSPSMLARQSTRLVAAAAFNTQATYDVVRWAPDIFGPEYPEVTNATLVSDPTFRDLLARFYGLPPTSDGAALLATLDEPQWRAYRADVDLLVLGGAGDPPLFIEKLGADVGPGHADFELLHHPRHDLTVRAAAIDAGVSVEANIPAYGVSASVEGVDFLIERLTE